MMAYQGVLILRDLLLLEERKECDLAGLFPGCENVSKK
jgi:hypothetical protein